MRALALLPLCLVLAACGSAPFNPCAENPDACTCAGPCVPLVKSFSGVMIYLWSGPPGATPPPCPSQTQAPHKGFLGSAPQSITCSPCSCAASAGTCFPPDMISANSAVCPADGSGVTHQPFNGPGVWDGTCTTNDAVATADSVTISPAILGGRAACAPASSKVTAVDGAKTIAIACADFPPLPEGLCESADLQCTYPKADDFAVCLVAEGDVPCPGAWTNKHLYFAEEQMCLCSCGSPSGEQCTTAVTVYEDSACQTPLGSVSVTSDDPATCLNVPPGSSLGSKSATLTYKAGTCAPKLTKTTTSTLCCLP